MALFPENLMAAAASVVADAAQKKIRIATAESCTGGLLSGCLTEIPGVSVVFDRGFVTYADDAKMAQLSVDRKTLSDFGAVSAETAIEMADGALRASHADIAVGITGIAGPSGGSEGKPVGTVFIALANVRNPDSHMLMHKEFKGDRAAIRLASVSAALDALRDMIRKL